MRYRIERERTDCGYGPVWIVLNAENGDYILECHQWADAIRLAFGMAWMGRS